MNKPWFRYLSSLLVAAASIATALAARPQSASRPRTSRVLEIPMATEDRVREPGWWPTKGTPARSEFAGAEACAQCHAQKARTQSDTPMARTSMKAEYSSILRQHEELNTRLGKWSYQLVRKPDGSVMSVSDGETTDSARLSWAFGIGHLGQTYIFERNGAFYESHLSYYSAIDGLDITPGHSNSEPTNSETGLGRRLDNSETHLCFGCHTTASTTSGRFDLEHLMNSVTCEACHGPGAKHVAAMEAGQTEKGAKLIFNPSTLPPVASVEFCGACHRTLVDVSLIEMYGIRNVRFQPYRLETSKCWGQGDARLTCTTCHDPHQQVGHDPGSYDHACLQCHTSGKQSQATVRAGKTCPIEKTNCVACHMQKYEIPGMHSKFTDHRIRIAREGAPFPD